MKNQITQEKGYNEEWENKRKSANQETAFNKQQQSSQYNKSFTQAKNLLAVVKLDIGEGQTDVIRVYQGDDIIKVVKNFCQLHELDEKCVVHMVRHITHEINIAQSKETKRQAIQQFNQNDQFLQQDTQQQSIQSSEKEDIQSQTTNSSSKQNYLQFNNPLSPGQTQGVNLDQFFSTSTNKSYQKTKEGSVRNVVEKNKQQEGEIVDVQQESDRENYDIQRNHYFNSQNSDFNQSSHRNKNKEDLIQMQGDSQEFYQARNTHKGQNEEYLKSLKEYKNITTKHDQQSQQNNHYKKQQQKMQENYEKWHKFIELKNNLNARSREDLKSGITNDNNLYHQNQHDDKRARSQSQRYHSPLASRTPASQLQNKNSQLKTDRRHAVSNHQNQNNNIENSNDFLDEYQILEKIRNEGLLPNNLTKAQQKMIIGNTKFSPKRQQKFLTSGSSGQPSSSSSSFTEKNLKNITATQLSNIEEINSSISQNTSRLDNNQNFQSNNSLQSSIVNQNLMSVNFNQNGQNLQNSIHLNKPIKNDNFIQKNNVRTQKMPIQNSSKLEQQQQQSHLSNQASLLSSRNSIKMSNQSHQNQTSQLQKRVQGIVPLLDIKKAKLENNEKNQANQYQNSSIQKSPRNVQTQRDNYNNEELIKISASGNLTDRDNKVRQEDQFQKSKKIPLSIRMKQHGSPDNNNQSNFALPQKIYNHQRYQEQNQKNSQESLENNSLLKYLQESTGRSPVQDNIVKVDLESYQKHKKVKTLTTPQTERSHKRDEFYSDYFQNTSQLDKSADLTSSKQNRAKNSSSIHGAQQTIDKTQKSPIRKNISDLEKQNSTFDITTNYNLSQIHQLVPNVKVSANNSTIHNPNEITFKKESKYSKNGPFILQGQGQKMVSGDLQQKLSPSNKRQQQDSNLLQDQSANSSHFPPHQELLVNRLLRQKEMQKPHEILGSYDNKSFQQQVKEPQKIQDDIVQQQSYAKIEFQDFLLQKIFKKMDSDGDGIISVLDVEINSLKTEILEILQNFLLELADNGNLKYSFNSFLEYISKNKQTLEALQQFYSKKYLNQTTQKNNSKMQSLVKQADNFTIQSPKQQQSFLQKQDQQQFNQLLSKQNEINYQQQIQQQSQQQQIQQQQKKQQQQMQNLQYVQQQNEIVNNIPQKPNPQNQQQQSYLPLQQQINQFNEQALQQQNQLQQSQQINNRANDISFNFMQPPSRNSLQSDQLSQPKLAQEFSFQPKFYAQLEKQQQASEYQQIQEEEDNNEEDPITHFVDLASHLQNKSKANNNGQSRILNMNNQNQQQQNKEFKNKQTHQPQSNSYQNVDHVNFSFCEDPQQNIFSTNNLKIKTNTNASNHSKEINMNSQNHSPSFHEQNNSYAGFGTQVYSNHPQDNIGQDLLISFSNQSIPYREPSFGNGNIQSNQFLNSYQNDNNNQNFQQGQSSTPQIISGRYKNLVQKQFNINKN